MASVIGNPDLAEEIGVFLLKKDIIIRDPSIPVPPKEPDAVKRRVEAALESGKKRQKTGN
jgi:hypothetical protein